MNIPQDDIEDVVQISTHLMEEAEKVLEGQHWYICLSVYASLISTYINIISAVTEKPVQECAEKILRECVFTIKQFHKAKESGKKDLD